MNLTLKDISKNYEKLSVLKEFNLSFEDNRITALLGASGCGKTTILNIISGLTDYEGQIEGKEGLISYIFQKDRLLKNLTVFQNLEYVLRSVDGDSLSRKQKIENILELVELLKWKDSYPSELSGGMLQRVSIARAFVYPSKILLMDEPFKGLDIALKGRLMRVFTELWQKDKRLTVFVTHDIDESLLLSDRVCVMKGLPASVILDIELTEPQNLRTIQQMSKSSYREKVLNALMSE